MPKYNKCRWRGKLVSECVYNKHIAIEKAREKRKTERAEETITETAKAETQEKYDECRILNLQSISKQLWCISCKQCLSFDFIENEERKGLGSIFTIRCHKCLLLNRVTSGPVHSVDGTHDRFDINSNVITGCIHSGIGYTKLNKILACMNIPTISWTTYKRYEEEVGNAAIKTAKDSCTSAAKLERQLTIENAKEIEQLM